MKTVHTPAMVAHLWANQSQAEARNGTPRDCNFYFERGAIYSYGSHFPIACHITDKAGKPVVLITQARYSNTTTKHITYTRQAAQHLDLISVPTLNGAGYLIGGGDYKEGLQRDCMDLLARFDKDIDRLAIAAGKGRPGGPNHRALTAQLAHRNAFAARMVKGNLSRARAMPENLKELAATAAKREAAQKAKALRERKARIVQRLVDWRKEQNATPQEVLNDWRNGGGEFERWQLDALRDWCKSAECNGVKIPADMPQELVNDGALLRVKPGEPETLETSLRAEVPLEHARKAFKLWQHVQAMVPPEGWQRAGDSTEGLVGQFKIDSIDKQGNIKAGCHFITAQEVADFGKRMGWAA